MSSTPTLPPAATRRVTLLVFFGVVVSALFYLWLPKLIAPMTSAVPSYAWEVFPWLKSFTNESLFLLRDDAEPLVPEGAFCLFYAVLFAIYAFALRLVKGRQSATLQAIVFAGGALFLAALALSPIMLSTDVYAYGFYGHLAAGGADAYDVDSSLVSPDPFLALFGHATSSIYGPFWTLISSGLARIGGSHVGLTVFLFRALAGGSVLLGAALIWSSLRRLAPERATQGLVFFLWNPLVITEAGLSGHNDASMMALVLLAIWLHVRGHRVGAVVALTLSALVKFVTGPLIPLYLLMTLRKSKGWGERLRLSVCAVLAAGMVTACILPLAHVKSNAPTREYATAPDFYSNNFHELLFKGLRCALGEDIASANIPIYFTGWWVKATTGTEIWTAPNAKASVLSPIKEGQRMLVVAPPLEEWMRIYDPSTRQNGYILGAKTTPTAFPSDEEADPAADQLENGPMEWPTVLKANRIIRIITCLLFAAFGLFAAWHTSSFEHFLLWAPGVMLAMYFTIMTQVWPWYLIWVVALGALKPGSAPCKLAALLSAGAMTLYATISFDQGDYPWVFYFRSFPAIVIPAAGFALYLAIRRLRARRQVSVPEIRPAPSFAAEAALLEE